MHIPDSMLQGTICPVTATLAIAGVAAVSYAATKVKVKPTAMSFAAVTALVFTVQMLNFPVQFGTSGHVIGATAAVALLGSAFGILSMALVIAAQCLVFADGGINVLGANILNMALLAALPAVVVREFILKENASAMFRQGAYFAAAWVAVMLAAAGCSLELALSGTVAFGLVFPAMLKIHAIIGLGEAALTALAALAFADNLIRTESRKSYLLPLGIVTFVGLLLSPFASSSPDGLEFVAATLGFLHESAPAFAAPFAGYTIPLVQSEVFAAFFAGLAGVAMLIPVSFGVAKILHSVK
jgi:cobalt/nickel transport system permease protein